ncbi:MAG: hypothetical protein ACI33K_12445, partial [Clostridiaceae bacterium]
MLQIDKNSFKRDYEKKFLEMHGTDIALGSDERKYETLGVLIRDYVAGMWLNTTKKYNKNKDKQV